ncbi:epimerase family protein SDR39U1-like isoform X2 [Carettochelys insculpta]|uniref:epimerase family protein SDR39U1-like isoform X2 n=1 Tax=Carettochelys insculpta TaxID=44489 RepID=UPI003EBD564D
MRVLVGGGTGFVGGAVTQLLRSRGHEVTHLSRRPGPGRISWDELARCGLPPCEAVLNVAGENVLNPFRRWDDSFRREVVASRVETTKALAKAIAEADRPPRAWVVVTGVGGKVVPRWRGACGAEGYLGGTSLLAGYYRPSPTAKYTEESPGGDFDFFSRLVTAWEAAAKIPGDRTRQVVVRSGVVLGRAGGLLSQLLWPFWLGLGGPVGTGLQPFPWIHARDAAGLLCHALETEGVHGVLNGVSPASPATCNADFARALGVALGRPAWLPLPAWTVRGVLGPERAVLVLEGQRVEPRRTLESGYRFQFPELPAALRDALS